MGVVLLPQAMSHLLKWSETTLGCEQLTGRLPMARMTMHLSRKLKAFKQRQILVLKARANPQNEYSKDIIAFFALVNYHVVRGSTVSP
jgi:hypothetical protein